MTMPTDEPAPDPVSSGQRHSGCDRTALESEVQQPDVGVDTFPVTKLKHEDRLIIVLEQLD